tara:strand:- start:164 stop:538 length:375 start_codon:yes stop_codon:yes gene_type:complete
MAQLNLTSSITASGLTSDTISSTVQKVATVTQGGISRTNITAVVGGTAQVVAAHADHTAGAYVYLKNAGALNLFIKTEAGVNAIYNIYLTPGEWALFPWAADNANIIAYASAASGCLIEYGVFE